MSDTGSKIAFICAAFCLTPRQLAKALNVSPATMERWRAAQNVPTGLHAEVLRALDLVAMDTALDKDRCRRIGGMVAMGIGSLITNLLTQGDL